MSISRAPTPPRYSALPSATSKLAAVVVLGYGFVFAVQLRQPGYEVVGGLALAPPLILAGAVLARSLGRRQGDPWVARCILWGYATKVAASLLFYWFVFGYFDGAADAGRYHTFGSRIATELRSGRLPADPEGGLLGSGAMDTLAGVLYAITGPSAVIGFLVFTTIAFVGSYLFYVALVTVTGRPHRLYAAMVFLFPSVLFWTASLGKEAWMMLTLGMASHGAARLWTSRRGVSELLIGLALAGWVRPHMAVLTVVSLFLAMLVVRRSSLSLRSRRARRKLLFVTGAAGAAAALAAQRMFGLDALTPSALSNFVDTLALNTAIGGSTFANVETLNPLLAPVALVAILFRPLPHEVGNLMMALASAEGLLLLVLILLTAPSLRLLRRSIRRDEYAAYAAAYCLLFGLAYSFFNNLGLLVRERVQVLPFLFVLLAVASKREGPMSKNDLSPGDDTRRVP